MNTPNHLSKLSLQILKHEKEKQQQQQKKNSFKDYKKVLLIQTSV